MESATELLTARELGSRLRVSPETVRAWGRRGFIPTVRLSRKVIRFNLQAVLEARSAAPAKGVARAE